MSLILEALLELGIRSVFRLRRLVVEIWDRCEEEERMVAEFQPNGFRHYDRERRGDEQR